MDTIRMTALLLTVSFQLFSWCKVSGKSVTTIVTLEPFVRQNRSKRFLRVTESGNEFRLSFTGRKEEQGTKFVLQRYWTGVNLHFRLRPARMPDHILAEDRGKLLVKNSSTVDPVDNTSEFEKKTIELKFIIDKVKSPEYYDMLIFGTSHKVMRCSCSGEVSLGKMKRWKQDWKAWVKMKSIN